MFGEELEAGSGTVNPYWYIGSQGYYRDQPGIMNVGLRKLIAANGVFLNRDLIGFAGGDVNLYRYVGNEPVGSVDPAGMACNKPCHLSGNVNSSWQDKVAPSARPYEVILGATRLTTATIVCEDCDCDVAPHPDTYFSFYQWIRVTEMQNIDPSPPHAGECKFVDWCGDDGSIDGKYGTQMLRPPYPTNTGCGRCSWTYEYYTCDFPGYHQALTWLGAANGGLPPCKWSPSEPANAWLYTGFYRYGMHPRPVNGKIVYMTWYGMSGKTELCTGIGQGPDEAFGNCVTWGQIVGLNAHLPGQPPGNKADPFWRNVDNIQKPGKKPDAVACAMPDWKPTPC